MAYDKKTKDKAKRLFFQGMSLEEIAKKMKINPDTLYRWRKDDGWESPELIEDDTVSAAKKKLKAIMNSDETTDKQLRAIEKMTKAIERLERTQLREEKEIRKQKDRRKFEAKKLDIEYIGTLKDAFYDECYAYQKEFWSSPEFAKVLVKPRQSGLSTTAGGYMVTTALETGVDQIATSASQRQAYIIKAKAVAWMAKHKIDWLPDGDNREQAIVLPGGVRLWFLPPVIETIQGLSGDVLIDEAAWIKKFRMLYSVLAGSLTVRDKGRQKRITIWSSPYDFTGYFSSLVHDEKNPFRKFEYDIHRCIRDGLDVDLDLVRTMFDPEMFAMLYECKWFNDALALLSVQDVLDAISDDDNLLSFTENPVTGGTDIGRHHDLTATTLVEMQSQIAYIRHMAKMLKIPWEIQQQRLLEMHNFWRFKMHLIDRTGNGDPIFEFLKTRLHDKVGGVWFDAHNKEAMALNVLRFFQNRRVKIPNDKEFIAHLHAIKRKPTDGGFKYDADRNEQIKHADWFWSLALALKPYDIRQKIVGVENTMFF